MRCRQSFDSTGSVCAILLNGPTMNFFTPTLYNWGSRLPVVRVRAVAVSGTGAGVGVVFAAIAMWRGGDSFVVFYTYNRNTTPAWFYSYVWKPTNVPSSPHQVYGYCGLRTIGQYMLVWFKIQLIEKAVCTLQYRAPTSLVSCYHHIVTAVDNRRWPPHVVEDIYLSLKKIANVRQLS